MPDMSAKVPHWVVPAYIAEIVGTYMLVLTVGFCVNTNGDCEHQGGGDNIYSLRLSLWNVMAIASTLTAMIYAMGPVSGANFNPAVSFALGLTGNMPWPRALLYTLSQILAGAAAGYSVAPPVCPIQKPTLDLNPTEPDFLAHFHSKTMAVECLYTCILVFVVLNCAVRKKNEYFGIAIGFVVIAGGYASAGLSSGAFNPAVAAGLDGMMRGGGFMVYCIAELVGAILGVLMFKSVTSTGGAAVLHDSVDTSKLASEFFGTFVLMVTVGLNVLGKSAAGAWSIAAALMGMVFSLGDISGANLNPAVTVAIALSEMFRGKGDFKGEVRKVLSYVFAQLLGGFLGGLLARWFRPTSDLVELKPACAIDNTMCYDWKHVAQGEAFFTFLLCIVVLSVCTTKAPLKETFGFAIGLCIVAGGNAAGHVCSVVCLNPAVALGLAPTASTGWLKFSAFELIGAFCAAILFWCTHVEEFGGQAPAPTKSLEGKKSGSGQDSGAGTASRRPRDSSPAPVSNRPKEE